MNTLTINTQKIVPTEDLAEHVFTLICFDETNPLILAIMYTAGHEHDADLRADLEWNIDILARRVYKEDYFMHSHSYLHKNLAADILNEIFYRNDLLKKIEDADAKELIKSELYILNYGLYYMLHYDKHFV